MEAFYLGLMVSIHFSCGLVFSVVAVDSIKVCTPEGHKSKGFPVRSLHPAPEIRSSWPQRLCHASCLLNGKVDSKDEL